MRPLPGDYTGQAQGWEEVVTWLKRLAEAQRPVNVHIGDWDGGGLYAQVHGRLHHVSTEADGTEWFAVGDTAPEPGDLGGPWSYLRLPKPLYSGAGIETIDDDDYFGIAITFGENSVLIGDQWT